VVTADGPLFGETVLADPRVRKSPSPARRRVGQWLVAHSAPNLTRLSLELGGPGAADRSRRRRPGRRGGGSHPREVPQHGPVVYRRQPHVRGGRRLRRVLRPLRPRPLAELTLGPGAADPDTGPLISDDAVRQVARHVDDALARGGTLLCGGKARPFASLADRFFRAHRHQGRHRRHARFTEETFGPLAAISRSRTTRRR